jgi:hypothetical protein
MKVSPFLLVLSCLFLSLGAGQVQYLQVRVDPVAVSRANFYLNVLATQVQAYNWVYCNRAQLYSTIANTLVWLRQIRNILPCGNVIDGSGNAVSGTNNVVVGSRNKVNGMNNWVFVSNYQTGASSTTFTDSVLAIGNYQIDLAKIGLISTNPSAAISRIDSSGYNTLCSKNVATSYFFSA